jgi:hypothetical protein
MLLLDTSFLIEFEDELAHQKIGPVRSVLAAQKIGWRKAGLEMDQVNATTTIPRPRRRHSRTINLSTTVSSLNCEAPNP